MATTPAITVTLRLLMDEITKLHNEVKNETTLTSSTMTVTEVKEAVSQLYELVVLLSMRLPVDTTLPFVRYVSEAKVQLWNLSPSEVAAKDGSPFESAVSIFKKVLPSLTPYAETIDQILPSEKKKVWSVERKFPLAVVVKSDKEKASLSAHCIGAGMSQAEVDECLNFLISAATGVCPPTSLTEGNYLAMRAKLVIFVFCFDTLFAPKYPLYPLADFQAHTRKLRTAMESHFTPTAAKQHPSDYVETVGGELVHVSQIPGFDRPSALRVENSLRSFGSPTPFSRAHTDSYEPYRSGTLMRWGGEDGAGEARRDFSTHRDFSRPTTSALRTAAVRPRDESTRVFPTRTVGELAFLKDNARCPKCANYAHLTSDCKETVVNIKKYYKLSDEVIAKYNL